MNHTTRTAVVALAALAVSCGLCGIASAGGVMDEEQDNHPYYFGMVKDTAGAAVVSAKVKVQTKTITLMTQSNDLGAYKLPIVGTQVKPDDVALSCSKDGYRQADVIVRSGAGSDGKTPVEIDCTLQRE